jgi:hypothetical protein
MDETRAVALDCMPGGHGGTDDPYRTNSQIADLNALTTALTVERWRRLFGFYRNGGGSGRMQV